MDHQYLATNVSRRSFISASAGASLGLSCGWFGQLAAASAAAGKPKRSCILLWMNGGPSQTDTFDMKPGHENGGPFKSIATRVPGIQICEHLPAIARWTDRLAIIRSMSTREGDHARARENLRTGYVPQASIQFPVLGSLVSKELDGQSGDLPNYVSISSRGLFGSGTPPAGFLGPAYAPLLVGSDGFGGEGENSLSIENLTRPDGVSPAQANDRLALLRQMEQGFLEARPGEAANSHRIAYQKAVRMMSPTSAKAFRIEDEPEAVQGQYGRSRFGKGCLLARRLVECGVAFVEVSLDGWDTHEENFPRVQNLCGVLDQAWSALMQDLQDRGLLETTLIVWMGEFGRTPGINPRQGRDHYPKAWSAVLGGGGVRGGQLIGSTSDDGMAVEERPVSTPDFLATVCLAMGLDPLKQNPSNVGRPIRLVDPTAVPLHEIIER